MIKKDSNFVFLGIHYRFRQVFVEKYCTEVEMDTYFSPDFNLNFTDKETFH